MEEFFYLTGMYPVSIDSLIEILLLKSKIIKEAGETAVRWMIQQNLLLKEEVLCQILREITGIMCSVCFTEAGMKVEDAVTKAVDECIREGALSEFSRNKSSLRKM